MAMGAAPAPMLEGKALLDKARALSNRPEEQIARACGYVGPSGRVLRKSFYRALVAAKGYSLPGVARSAAAMAVAGAPARGARRNSARGCMATAIC